ncbi:hypothetical protein thsrh120_51230 [Rhizobium sp. No.120]
MPAHGDALALAAGKLTRIAVEIRHEIEGLGGRLQALLDAGGRLLLQTYAAEAECGEREPRRIL